MPPRHYGLSALLHLGLILVMAFGLPALMPDEPPMPTAMTVEIVPISEITNLRNSQKPLTKTPTPAPKEVKPVPPTKKEKAVEPPKKDAVPLPDKPKEPTKKEEKKPEPKKEETKPKQQDEEDDFAVLMNKLKTEKTSEDDTEKPKKDANDGATSKSDTFDESMPISVTEMDSIRSQFVKCWRMPAGARGDYDLTVTIHVELNREAQVVNKGLTPSQAGRYTSDPFFRAAADSALRAVVACSPLQGLKPERYNAWKSLKLNFDPSELLM